MKEFMFYIRNHASQKPLTPEVHQEFVRKCESYITMLQNQGKLKSAQPIAREGMVISRTSDNLWNEAPFGDTAGIMVGYYHILANDLDEAIAIAKQNPEFEYKPDTATIEVRAIKMKEVTGFVYPS